jgi:predicted DNA-binding transcriptional regulator AlpA
MATSEKFFVNAGIEPLTLTVEQTVQATGESRSKIYELIGTGEYEAKKAGSRTLIVYASIKRRIAALPAAKIKAPKSRRPQHAANANVKT